MPPVKSFLKATPSAGIELLLLMADDLVQIKKKAKIVQNSP